MAYRILVASLVLCLLLVVGLSLLERTGLIEIDEKEIQPEVVSCQIGHKDMEVGVFGSRAAYRGEVVPRYEFWLPPFGGCAVYYWDRPKADQRNGTHLACSSVSELVRALIEHSHEEEVAGAGQLEAAERIGQMEGEDVLHTL